MDSNQLLKEINEMDNIIVPANCIEKKEEEKEISDEDKLKMIDLMELHNCYTEKIKKINIIRKDLNLQITCVTEELQELMEKYNLEELYRNSHKFVLEKKFKKKATNIKEFKNVLSVVLGDEKTEEIFDTMERIKDFTQVSELKCHSY
jgi:hypothetical protein